MAKCKLCGKKIEYNQYVIKRGIVYHPSCWNINKVQLAEAARKRREAKKLAEERKKELEQYKKEEGDE